MDNPSLQQQYPPHPGSSPEPRLDLRHYWHVLSERRWLALTAFIAVTLLAALYLVRAERIFQASVQLQIDREANNVLNLDEVFSSGSREIDYLQTQFKKLRSRALAEKVADKLQLHKDPRYATSSDLASAVLRAVTVAPIRMTRLVDVRVQHPDPRQAEKMARTIARVFIDQNINEKTLVATNAESWLKNEVSRYKTNVDVAERALHQYREKHKQISLEETENIARQSLQQAQTDATRASIEAGQAHSTLREVERLLQAGASLDTIPEITANVTISKLKQDIAALDSTRAALEKRYRAKHPKLVANTEALTALRANVASESQKLLESIRNSARFSQRRFEAAAKLLKEKEAEQLALNKLRIDYDVLRRQAENEKAIYETLLTRFKEAQLTGSMTSNNMRIVDELPAVLVKPKLVQTILLGLVGGGILAVGLAFFVSYLDDSIKSQEDVENHLRLPFLGYIPNVKSNSLVERSLQADAHPHSTASESFRTVRATLTLAEHGRDLRVLAFSSTIPSEGKSLVSSNMAVVTAQAGHTTLLVDVDLRRPSLHKSFQLHSPVGLAAYLDGTATTLGEVVHSTHVPNLDVVCCGAIPSNPSELIGSKRMHEFIAEAKAKYDRVILDCPPISAVSDPLIAAAHSDGLLFVTKFNKIRREQVQRSVQRIQNAGIKILGVVINDIDFEGKDSYYYSYYYYQNRYYGDYKANEGEDSDAPRTRG